MSDIPTGPNENCFLIRIYLRIGPEYKKVQYRRHSLSASQVAAREIQISASPFRFCIWKLGVLESYNRHHLSLLGPNSQEIYSIYQQGIGNRWEPLPDRINPRHPNLLRRRFIQILSQWHLLQWHLLNIQLSPTLWALIHHSSKWPNHICSSKWLIRNLLRLVQTLLAKISSGYRG